MSSKETHTNVNGDASDSESEEEYELYHNDVFKKKKREFKNWTSKERGRLIDGIGLLDGNGRGKIRHWSRLERYIETKTSHDVERYINFLSSLQDGKPFKFFRDRLAIDAWLALAQELTKGEEDIAGLCIPQLLTVASAEPIAEMENYDDEVPNYGKIYEYLAAILRGTEVPSLSPVDAGVICELLDGLSVKTARKNRLLQTEAMRTRVFAYEDFIIRRKGLLRKDGKIVRERKGSARFTPLGNARRSSEENSCEENEVGDSNVPTNSELTEENEESDSEESSDSDDEDDAFSISKFPSLNPFNLPLDVLEFTAKHFKL